MACVGSIGLATLGANAPIVKLAIVPEDGESPLLLVRLPPPEAADAVRRAWDEGLAVGVVDPDQPRRRLDAVVASLRPNAVVDHSGTSKLDGGRRLPAGIAAVVSTSGTTGGPRSVLLSRAAVQASARAVTDGLGIEPGADRWLACLPLHAVAGLAIVARSYFCGTPLTVHPGFSVDAVAESAGTCTIVSLVPTQLVRLLEARAPVSRFRRILLGGGPVEPDLLERCVEAGGSPTTTYGLTETCGGCAHDGHPLPGVDLRVADDGEILVGGGVLMNGYLDDEVATRAAFTSDGRLRTGDLGRVEVDGRIVVTDRKKDIVISGGVNVSPSVVERVLLGHPQVAEVCVVGLPDDEWGERVVAFVVPPGPGAPLRIDELRAFAAPYLARAELPREVRELAELPRSPGGKVLRRQLRSQVVADRSTS
jgi:o-succinylbenzoate---CoA ligase